MVVVLDVVEVEVEVEVEVVEVELDDEVVLVWAVSS